MLQAHHNTNKERVAIKKHTSKKINCQIELSCSINQARREINMLNDPQHENIVALWVGKNGNQKGIGNSDGTVLEETSSNALENLFVKEMKKVACSGASS